MDPELSESLEHRQLGERLKDARKARGLTQEAVADQLGILRTTLVAIENGTRQVTPAELVAMAGIYGRLLSEFVSKRANKVPLVPQFRRPPGQLGVAEKDLLAAAIDLDALAKDFVELEEINDSLRRVEFPPTYAIEVPGASPDQRGEEVAAEERTRLGLGDGPISDLRALLEEAVGIRIFYLDLPPKVGGLFACNDELGACIAINRKHPTTRGNWSLAHEYGHFLTTRYVADVSLTHNYWGKMSAEKFADSFAKNFLMPRIGVTRRLSDMVKTHGKGATVGDVMSLAHFYQVSAEAMFRRLEEFKRLPLGTWAKLRQKQSFPPEPAREALGLSMEPRPAMLPLRYRLLAQSAYEHRERLTEGQLARKLRTDRVSARLELEALHGMADDAGGADGLDFAPIDLDMSEVVPG